MPEDDQSRLDRELIELLNELRVALPGVQVLFAFLLTVPFSQGFVKVTDPQKDAFFVAFLAAAAASVLLIAPSAFHRLRWRQRDKERLLKASNKMMLAGLFCLAVAMTAAVFVISDYLFGDPTSWIVTALIAAGFALFWYALPMWGRAG
ncbi:MAG: DUF6328 family protein [Actinomycetota bacterium]